MVVHDKLVGEVPLRVRETCSDLVFRCVAIEDETAEDPNARWLKLTNYDIQLEKLLETAQRSSVVLRESRENFSVWKWEPNIEYSLIEDDPLNRLQGSNVEILVWERLNVLWNLAVVRSQQAATIAAEDRGQRCVVLNDVMRLIQNGLDLIADHPDFPNASAVSNKQFWLTWKDFINTRIQRCNYSFLHVTGSAQDMLASSAAGCAACLRMLLQGAELLKPMIQETPLVSMWKESAAAVEVLFKIFAEYHGSFPTRFKRERLQLASGLVDRFYSLCEKAKTSSLVELKGKVEPELRRIIHQASCFAAPDANTVRPPDITPWFYACDEKGGRYFKSPIKAQGGGVPSNLAISEPKKKRFKSETPNSKSWLQGKVEETNQDFDLSKICERAISSRRWVFVAVWSNETDDAASSKIRLLVTEDGLVNDIMKDNLLFHGCFAKHAATFITHYGVTSFPFLAIIHPMTQKVRWSLSQSELSSCFLLADIIAEACMDLCSHDAFEGLSGEIKDRPLPGCDPPVNLIYTAGGFRAALKEAATVQRWMLVNLQSDDCLASHFLNRDVWGDELVDPLVRKNFVFCQFDVSEEGRVFVKVFNVKKFPHISILDPFSGSVVWRRDGWTTEDPFTNLMFAEATLNLPDLESRKVVASHRSSATDPGDGEDDESSWDLCSLFESWEKLSVGTSCTSQPDLAGLTLGHSTNSGIPNEITTLLEET